MTPEQRANLDLFANSSWDRTDHATAIRACVAELDAALAEIAHMRKVAHQLHSTDTSQRTHIGWRVVRTRKDDSGEREYFIRVVCGGRLMLGSVGVAHLFDDLESAEQLVSDLDCGLRVVKVFLRVVRR